MSPSQTRATTTATTTKTSDKIVSKKQQKKAIVYNAASLSRVNLKLIRIILWTCISLSIIYIYIITRRCSCRTRIKWPPTNWFLQRTIDNFWYYSRIIEAARRRGHSIIIRLTGRRRQTPHWFHWMSLYNSPTSLWNEGVKKKQFIPKPKLEEKKQNKTKNDPWY